LLGVEDETPGVQVSYGNGGWVRVDHSYLPGPLYLRFAADDEGRWHTRELYLEGEDRHIEAADLRRLPLTALETVILADDGSSMIAAKATIPGPDLATLASYFASSFGSVGEHHWVAESLWAQLPDGENLRVSRLQERSPVVRPDVPPLAAPEEGLTDDFLRHVAAAYVAAVTAGLNPAPELARQTGRPARTVHRWIYIARQRGLLPPAGRTAARRALPTEEDTLQPVVAAIVTSDLGVLVGRRNDGKPPWTFIAGEQEPGERVEDTAIREVKEETTLRIQAGDVIGERVHPKTGRTMIYMAARPTHGTEIFVGDEDELAEVRWVSLAEADELLPGMFEPVREHLARELGD
jgi:8-oxo-dGTP pyrophosphatase MutT (NUDIX family)